MAVGGGEDGKATEGNSFREKRQPGERETERRGRRRRRRR